MLTFASFFFVTLDFILKLFMSDVIHLLPDSVANQIAAGEVVQRPASVVKELLENGIDAGATTISLVIKEAGKNLIQIIDNGSGMSETDARLCFERHATSKIKKADDLFALNTKGFRGEALASIAAIAQVELKTKSSNSELGIKIIIEGSEVKEQEACATPVGTSFSVKNLFYNVPARRNFLKSTTVETKHIIEEFQRVAMVHADIAFSMYNNGNEVFNLPKGSFRQRIVSIYGSKYNQRLVPVNESTDIVNVEGFISKPEFAKKTRGEQYFFVNDRFIKNAYLNHAVQNAFEELLSKDQFPSYFLKLTIDPSKIDINIHPTKTEIKFEDERAIYAIIRTSVKQALGKFNISPTLDFEQETSFNIPLSKTREEVKIPTIRVNENFNPFDTKTPSSNYKKEGVHNWGNLYDSFEKDTSEIINHQQGKENTVEQEEEQSTLASDWSDDDDTQEKTMVQLHNKYVLAHLKTGFLIIDQQRAHERILYEQFLENIEKGKGNIQQLLFPETLELTSTDFELMQEIEKEIMALGFDINRLGTNTYVVTGVPAELKDQNVQKTVESLLEQFKINKSELKLDKRDNLATSMARSASIKSGQKLSAEEMSTLVDQLFACKMPYALLNGRPIIVTMNLDDLNKKFDY